MGKYVLLVSVLILLVGGIWGNTVIYGSDYEMSGERDLYVEDQQSEYELGDNPGEDYYQLTDEEEDAEAEGDSEISDEEQVPLEGEPYEGETAASPETY
jgi:hypothetical protein